MPIKTLIVMAVPPLPEGGAPGRCALALMRGLAANGADVRAIAAKQVFAGSIPNDVQVELVSVDTPVGGWRGVPKLLRRPRGDLCQGAFAQRVRDLAPHFDVVHLEQVDTAWCDDGFSTPSLVHLHFRARRDQSLGLPWRQQFRSVLVYALAERAAIRRHRYLVASSPLIAEGLRKEAPHAEVVHAPLSLDPQYYEKATLDGPPIAGIIGTGFWPPTAAAIRRLANVWPTVQQLVPEARLLIAGRGVENIPNLVIPPGAEIVGEVASAGEFLRSLSLLLYPVERGSGMKVKVLEAIASGIPVVTTPAGAEGIRSNDGVVVNGDDGVLALAAAGILRDANERRQRGEAARTAFLSHYTPKVAAEPLADLYQRMSVGGRTR
jgi:glycosyltransferase involved in cell wall biosynthesis